MSARPIEKTSCGATGSLSIIRLPAPGSAGRLGLTSILERRRTTREISDKPLPLRVLSTLLWGAWGINRARGPFGLVGRTAASASNSQEIELYVALEAGAYRYEPESHALIPACKGDLRPFAISAGQRKLGRRAPARLLYVADIERLEHSRGFQEPGLCDPQVQRSYYFVDTGLIAANVYLLAAAMGLGAWFHNCDRAALSTRLGLGKRQRPLFAQTVGYPKAS